jgi:hypothetical protein
LPVPRAAVAQAAAAAPTSRDEEDTVGDAMTMDPDFDLSSTLDVPAFLRRQEG